MQRRHMLVAGAAATAGAFAAWPCLAQASVRRWALATGYRADGYHARNLQALGDELRQASAGAFMLDVKADNQLVPLAGIPDAVAGGQPPLGEVLMSGLSKRWPACGADSVPFITHGYEDAWRLWNAQRPVVESALAASGLTPLMAVPWPGQGLFSKNPIRAVDDLRGTRMRVYNPTTQRIAELLEAHPVQVPAAEIGQALADGRIDTLITSAVTGVEQQVWQWVGHFYDLNAWMPKNLVIAHRASLEALPPALRDTLERLAQAGEKRGWATCRQVGTDALGILRTNKMQTEPAPPLLARSLQRLGEHFSLEWVREVGPQANAILLPYYAAT